MDKFINLKDMAGIESFSAHFARLDDLYILSRIDNHQSPDGRLPGVGKPLRLDGMLFLLVHEGKIDLQINTRDYVLKPHDILVVRPGTLVLMSGLDKGTEFTILFISSTFLHSIQIDLNSIEFTYLLKNPRPALQLNAHEADIVRKYFDLLTKNASGHSESGFAPRIASNLIAALVYEIMRTTATHGAELDAEDQEDKQNRAYGYVFRFMQLLHINYATHRNLDFYSEQLCITPKYLSLITKEITGYSASEWINRVVILEAKNIMLFSGKNIQEVAYALNFPSQSAFGKYFKRLTGQSPSEFMKHET